MSFPLAVYIYPDGFKSQVLHVSSVDPHGERVLYKCEVLGEGEAYWPKPTFRVTAADRPNEPIERGSPTECWKAVRRAGPQ